jgi:hypothetical protein
VADDNMFLNGAGFLFGGLAVAGLVSVLMKDSCNPVINNAYGAINPWNENRKETLELLKFAVKMRNPMNNTAIKSLEQLLVSSRMRKLHIRFPSLDVLTVWPIQCNCTFITCLIDLERSKGRCERCAKPIIDLKPLTQFYLTNPLFLMPRELQTLRVYSIMSGVDFEVLSFLHSVEARTKVGNQVGNIVPLNYDFSGSEFWNQLVDRGLFKDMRL